MKRYTLLIILALAFAPACKKDDPPPAPPTEDADVVVEPEIVDPTPDADVGPPDARCYRVFRKASSIMCPSWISGPYQVPIFKFI